MRSGWLLSILGVASPLQRPHRTLRPKRSRLHQPGRFGWVFFKPSRVRAHAHHQPGGQTSQRGM